MGNEPSKDERDSSEILYSLDEEHRRNPRVM
jgi:hypothetical protein